MAERSNAAVLKTVEGQPSQGSNPCLSAKFLIPYPEPEQAFIDASIIRAHQYSSGAAGTENQSSRTKLRPYVVPT